MAPLSKLLGIPWLDWSLDLEYIPVALLVASFKCPLPNIRVNNYYNH